MLTPFGIEVRKLRLDRGMRLLDLAKKLGKQSAYVSAVESGQRPIPKGYVEAIVRVMKLGELEADHLQRSADRTRKEVTVDCLDATDRELVGAFARRMHELPDDLLRQLKTKVFKSISDGVPFTRRRRGYSVPPLSTEQIWRFSEAVRNIFVDDDEVAFPIMDVLEFRLHYFFNDYSLELRTCEELGPEEGRVLSGSSTIELREDVYENAWKGYGRDRFTACHELGHFLIHRSVGLSRTQDRESSPIYCDSEWQADSFAGALMMSRRHLDLFEDGEDAAEQCEMTYHAGEVMWNKYKQKGILSLP